jgi:hypothetical protein
MAYRNGTYVAFHAEGTDVPTDSDMKYYNLLKAWTAKEDDDFSMVNSHEKTSAVRDSSKRATLRASLVTRLRNSKHLLLIIGDTTKLDTDWVPFEIEYAIDDCDLPVIAAYTDYGCIQNPASHAHEWPEALKTRIENGTARVIHIPFKKEPIAAAIEQFDPQTKPKTGLSYYTRETYAKWGINPD